MTENDFDQFADGLTVLGEVFDRTLTPATIQIYFAALADLEFEIVAQAFSAAARNLRFFPKPIEVRELIQGTPADRGQIAWETLTEAIRRFGPYASVTFADRALATAIQETFGGWIEACTKLPANDDPMHANYRKRFEVAHTVAGKKPADQLRTGYLIGIAEAGNRNNGQIDREFSQIVGVVEGPRQMHEVRATFDQGGRLTADSRALLGMSAEAETLNSGPYMSGIGSVLRLVGKGVA